MTNKVKTGRAILPTIISVLALCSYSADAQKRPPNYSQDDMPVTNFKCRDKIVGGYYADPETDCQMFHVCVHIPGIGIQNFRFLCPNDTLFDQEHQICDDWYNIDCELSSLYYSDNFDLYRIGVNHEVKKPPVSHKGTPIPLGPSTTTNPWQNQPTKGYYSDEDDDYKRGGNDILRGSHSSNFYASKNKGRDDLDHDYDFPNAGGAQRQEVNQPTDIKKHKTFVRKLAGKRPVTQRTTITSSYLDNTVPPTASPVFPQRVSAPNYNQNYNGNKVSAPKSRGNVSFSSYTSKTSKLPEQQRTYNPTTVPTIYQKINNLTEIEQDTSQEYSAPPVFDVSKSYKNSYNFRIQVNPYNQKNVPKTSFESTTAAFGSHTESQRLPSTDYLRNIAQTYQQPAAVINDQLQDTGKNTYFQQSQYNQYQKTQTTGAQPTFATYNNEYQQYNNYQQPSSYQTTAKVAQSPDFQVYYNSPTNRGQQSPSTTQFAYQSYTTPTAYVQPNTTVFDYYKYYQTSTQNAVTQKARTSYSSTSTFNYYQQPSSSTVSPAKYDPYATFQKANEKYDDEEFLKTAPSSNLKPSDLNTIHNLKKQQYINATLKAAYSVDPPKSSSFAIYQPVAVSNTAKSAPVQSRVTTTYPTRPIAETKAPVTAQSLAQGPLKVSAAGSTVSTKSGSDYDYAYYDNAGSSEYDQADVVEEDFAKISKVQKS